MAFHRKRRRFRAGVPEIVGLVLLASTIASGARWYANQSRDAGLLRTSGQIVQAAGGDATAARLVYTYSVDGIIYSNVTGPDLAGRTLASLLPLSIMAKLQAHGILSFDDLPEDVRRQIREGTTHTFDELTDADRIALEKRGYQNAEDLRLSLLAAMDPKLGVESTSSERGAGVQMDVSVPILYDPRDPSYSVIAGPDGQIASTGGGSMAPFLTVALLTCLYFGVLYPRLKRRGQ